MAIGKLLVLHILAGQSQIFKAILLITTILLTEQPHSILNMGQSIQDSPKKFMEDNL